MILVSSDMRVLAGVAVVLGWSTASVHAQVFETVGARALGMGGAFVAVADDAAAVAAGQHPKAAILGGRVDQGDPAGDDELSVTVGAEVAGVLVPGYVALLVVGQLRADTVDR